MRTDGCTNPAHRFVRNAQTRITPGTVCVPEMIRPFPILNSIAWKRMSYDHGDGLPGIKFPVVDQPAAGETGFFVALL